MAAVVCFIKLGSVLLAAIRTVVGFVQGLGSIVAPTYEQEWDEVEHVRSQAIPEVASKLNLQDRVIIDSR